MRKHAAQLGVVDALMRMIKMSSNLQSPILFAIRRKRTKPRKNLKLFKKLKSKLRTMKAARKRISARLRKLEISWRNLRSMLKKIKKLILEMIGKT